MNYHSIQFWYFAVGSAILILSSLISMIVHHYKDGYSIKYDRLSYTGVRNDFTHPIRGSKYTKSSYPEILNLGLIIPGILYLMGFLRIEGIGVKFLGSLFSIIIIIIGAVDVSTLYHLHNGAVIASQPIFLILVLYVLLTNFNVVSLLCFISVFGLVTINVYQKQIQNRNPGIKVNVIPQKLFIYLEAIYFVLFPIFVV